MGNTAKIVQAPTTLTCGDIALQGLPFYGGLIAYDCDINVNGASLNIALPRVHGTFARVLIDGKDCGTATYRRPHAVTVDGVSRGTHKLTVEVCIPRANAFGPVHSVQGSGMRAGPAAWRTEGEKWSDDYCLTVQGLLKKPIIEELG